VNKKIRVLVVDDSLLFREVLSRGISSDPNIEVIARAEDAFDARDKILKYEPDVMTCDVEMPKMNGIEFIRRLLPQYSLPVIVVSSVNHTVFDALNVGAVDFVTKPNVNSARSVEGFIHELIQKIKIASNANINPRVDEIISPVVINNSNIDSTRIIAIGASTGGTEAIYTILRALPVTVPGIVIVQHIPPVFSKMFADRLRSQTKLFVKEAENGDIVEPGKVIIAPGDRHMKIKKQGDKFRIELIAGERINGHCPSVDVLFESVAKEVGANSVGIVLTGMGYDGAKGLLSMRRKGARTIGQDQQSSVVYGMPKVAYDIGAVEKQTSLSNIPNVIFSITKKNRFD